MSQRDIKNYKTLNSYFVKKTQRTIRVISKKKNEHDEILK